MDASTQRTADIIDAWRTVIDVITTHEVTDDPDYVRMCELIDGIIGFGFGWWASPPNGYTFWDRTLTDERRPSIWKHMNAMCETHGSSLPPVDSVTFESYMTPRPQVQVPVNPAVFEDVRKAMIVSYYKEGIKCKNV
jgi:hypothetical protein